MERKTGLRSLAVGTIQPSEFVKIFIILALARVIEDHHLKNQIKTIQTDFWLLVKMGIVTMVPLILIIKQDLGTSLVFLAILIGMIFISGISWKLLAPIVYSWDCANRDDFLFCIMETRITWKSTLG